MEKVFKYSLPNNDLFDLDLPAGSEILHVDKQLLTACVWVKVDPSAPNVVRRFAFVGTGHELPDAPLKHVGTVLYNDGEFVFHLFEIIGEGGTN